MTYSFANKHEKKVQSLPLIECNVCQMKFKMYRELKSHMKTAHTGPQPFSCMTCKATFSQTVSLQLHIATVHLGKKPEDCSISYNKTKRHIEIIHERKSFGKKQDKEPKKFNDSPKNEQDMDLYVQCDTESMPHKHIANESVDPLAM